MLTAWRLVKTRHLATAFDGEAARQYGGRWNSPGTRMVYLSEHLSLAVLEVLVHLEASVVLDGYSAIKVEFEATMATTIDRHRLPTGWRLHPPPSDLRRLGDQWIAAGRSAVLRVPGAVVGVEHNYLLNPLHPDVGQFAHHPPVPFALDTRLVTG